MDGTTYTLNNSFNIDGIITTNSDKDVFQVTLFRSLWTSILEAIPGNVGSNSSAQILTSDRFIQWILLIRTYDHLQPWKVTIDTTLSAGTYYIMIDGTVTWMLLTMEALALYLNRLQWPFTNSCYYIDRNFR